MYYDEPKRGNGMGISALVLGIVGLVIGLLPVINYLTMAGAVVGLVLGAIGIFKGRSQWLAAWGTVLSGAAIVLSVVVNVKFVEEVENRVSVLDNSNVNVESSAENEPAEKQKPGQAAVSNGVYEVGVDLPPGQYKTAGPNEDSIVPYCYWARLKDDSGSFDALIANHILEGPGSVTVNVGEFVEFSGDCTWTKVK